MPLIDVHIGSAVAYHLFDVSAFHDFLIGKDMWDVPRGVLQLNVTRSPEGMLYPETDLYLSIRAKAKKDRTPERVKAIMEKMEKWLTNAGMPKGKIRVELYEPSLQFAHGWNGAKAKL